ncbi:MAG TPA: SMP-30/gluconolactonase/LRE family protein [Conexibacter sp.]|nr:SMP-30/gluconolactonase/LRE family protein [Conexibacter sp.]
MIETDLELVVAGDGLSEGPEWDERDDTLWWVDIVGQSVHHYDPATGTDVAFDLGQPVGAAVPRESGGLVVAIPNGFAAFDPTTGALDLIAEVEGDVPANRMNDAKCDSAGRLWGGTMSTDLTNLERGSAALYCLDTDCSVRKVLTGVSISNGLGWSPDDRTMYFIDTLTYGVDAFDFDVAAGTISNRRRLITFSEPDGMPDGMTVDAEGYLWVAVFRSWVLRRFAPDGVLDAVIRLPVPQATSCGFAGRDKSDLYVTTYRAPDTPPDSPAGGVFRCRLPIEGRTATMFRG